jgi:hypothetical protein
MLVFTIDNLQFATYLKVSYLYCDQGVGFQLGFHRERRNKGDAESILYFWRSRMSIAVMIVNNYCYD